MSTSAKPNIVLFLIDDLGCRDLGAFGSSFYETPHLDRLVANGMKFNNAYASCPVCSPTRASIMSGQYPARVGVTQFIGGSSEGKLKDVPYLHYLPLEHKTVASALRDGGYQTWHVGKWHLGDTDFYPEKQGFDVNVGGCHWGMPKQGYFAPWGIETLDEADDGTYLTDHLTDKAIELIQNKGDKPFYLNFNHYAVHTPIQAPEALVEKYKAKAKRLKLDEKDPFVKGEYHPCIHKSDKEVVRRMMQSDPVYAAMMENLDTNIGKVVAALEAAGELDNTLIMFTSDNGGLSTSEGSPTCNLPMSEGKGWAYEGGIRVCQLAHWPGKIAPGSQCDENVTSTDFYPTFLEAAGLDLLPEQHCDGESMLPSMIQQGSMPERTIYWHYPHYSNQGDSPGSMALAGEWKLIQHFENDYLELYNLKADVSEVNNVADAHPEIRDRLFNQLEAWQTDVEAKIPEPNPGWEAKIKRPQVENNAHV